MAKAKGEEPRSTPVPLAVALCALVCLGSIVGAIIALPLGAAYLSAAFAVVAILSGLVFIGWILHFLFFKSGSVSDENPDERR